MKKRFFYWVLMAVLTLLLAGPQAMAKDKDKKGASETPPGWEKGAKKGWESDVPPKHDDKEAKEAISGETAAGEEIAEEAGKKTEKAKKESKKAKEKAREAKEISE